MRTKCLMLLIFFTATLFAKRGEETIFIENHKIVTPWFTGPILAPSGHIVPLGDINIEPYIFATTSYAKYDKNWKAHSVPNIYTINPQVLLWVGLTDWMDIQVAPQFYWNKTGDVSSTHVGDYPVSFSFQLLTDDQENWWPAIKFTLREIFPTGTYQKLNPQKRGMDVSGLGSFVTGIGLTCSRTYWCGGLHWLDIRLVSLYNILSRVHVKGFNAYGGGFGTNGYVFPGQEVQMTLGLQYSLTRNWALAMDVRGEHGAKTPFKGNKGIVAPGVPASVGGHSYEQYSIAPAIEYNWSSNLGIIAGCWFSVAGRNSNDFASAVIAVDWYISSK